MNVNTDKIPVEVIKEGAFRGTYFRDIYSVVNGIDNSGKNLMI